MDVSIPDRLDPLRTTDEGTKSQHKAALDKDQAAIYTRELETHDHDYAMAAAIGNIQYLTQRHKGLNHTESLIAIDKEFHDLVTPTHMTLGLVFLILLAIVAIALLVGPVGYLVVSIIEGITNAFDYAVYHWILNGPELPAS